MEPKTEQEYLEMLTQEYKDTPEWKCVQTMLAAFPAKEVWEALESF